MTADTKKEKQTLSIKDMRELNLLKPATPENLQAEPGARKVIVREPGKLSEVATYRTTARPK